MRPTAVLVETNWVMNVVVGNTFADDIENLQRTKCRTYRWFIQATKLIQKPVQDLQSNVKAWFLQGFI